ncbi:Aldose 1-epimerase [Smittium culicis]|uniref:Aldose 1-epimerase n=1 Tax=Smittium culicis TaxID=133412 RepID=A0A1R1XMZ5_9FUNG|nr:Aldose 1-epimerase [Smittium culicis]OMJ16002.1 Aldose 1-epimerase [Smittium culicis]
MSVESFPISKDGSVNAYKLTNKDATLIVQVSTFGARLTHLWTLDKNNELTDIILGFDSHEEMVASYDGKLDPYISAVIGRISGSIYPCDNIELNNTTYSLQVNVARTGASHHGGLVSIDKHIWSPEIVTTNPPSVKFTTISPHNECNYPGTLEISITYTVTDENQLKLEYRAKFLDDGPLNDTITETALSLTNHAYFNLTGFKEPTVDNHTCNFTTCNYLLSDMENFILNGEMSRDYSDKNVVLGKPDPVEKRSKLMDFMTQPKNIGPDIHNPLLAQTFGGYDNIYAVMDTKLNDGSKIYPIVNVAKIWSNLTGICMKVSTDEPCFVFYTGNSLPNDLVGKKGIIHGKHAAFSFETQRFNNAINIPKWKDMVTLKRGQLFSQNTIFGFSNDH